MSTERFRALRTFRRRVLLVSVLVAAGSLAVLLLNPEDQANPFRIASRLAADALFSGATAALIFASLASREAEQQFDLVLDRVLRDVFRPLRSIIESNAITGYRFDTLLAEPEASDAMPDHAVQYTRLAYVRDTLPAQVSIACIASMDDDALEPFRDTERYLYRWQIDSDLSPADPMVFAALQLCVDNHRIQPTIHQRRIRGVDCCEYRYRVPGHLRMAPRCSVAMVTRSRRYFRDSSTGVKVILFRTATDAEFSFAAVPELGYTSVSVGCNVAGLGPVGDFSAGPTYTDDHVVAAHARFSSPLQAGTSVTFYVNRPR